MTGVPTWIGNLMDWNPPGYHMVIWLITTNPFNPTGMMVRIQEKKPNFSVGLSFL